MSRHRKRCPGCGTQLVVTTETQVAVNVASTGREGLKEDAIDEIIDQVATLHGISRLLIIGRTRAALVVDARADLARRLRDSLHLSTFQSGQIIGGRDHTTIMNLLRRKSSAPSSTGGSTGKLCGQVGDTLGIDEGVAPSG